LIISIVLSFVNFFIFHYMKIMAHKEKQISKTNETGEYARKISIAATINVTFSLILS